LTRRGALLLGAALFAPALVSAQEPGGERSVHREFLLREGLEKPDAVGTSGYRIVPLDRSAAPQALTREIFGYFPYWFRSGWARLDYGLVSTIAYFCAEVGADGTIISTHGWPRYAGDPAASADLLAMISRAHANGVQVVLCFTNFDGASIHTLTSTAAYRENFIAQALAIVRAGDGQGINIDFEGVQSGSRDSLTSFMHAVADSFHVQIPGSQVSCAPTDFDTRPGDWDLPALYPFVDLFFFQGYGYHYKGSGVTGPIGLLPSASFWGSTNITTLISAVLSRIPADKVLLGLPHFGYRWASTGPDPKSPTRGTGVAFYYPDALGTIAVHGRQWDIPGLNPWYRYYADTSWFQGWYDDPESMGYKYEFALARKLKGIGMWALGMDGANHDIWDVLASYFAGTPTHVLPVPGSPPQQTALLSSYPNPFNPHARIRFLLPIGGDVDLRLYDLLGREVRQILAGPTAPGETTIEFDGSGLASGVYVARLISTSGEVLNHRMVILR
jgi:hypothetical protein